MVDCSFIVAMYNRRHTIDRCLDSIVYQRTKRTFEVIVVDDQSTDSSMEIVKGWQERHPGLIRVFSNPEKGVAKAKNLGIRESLGTFVSFVDSDDYIDYRFLENMLGADSLLSADMLVSPIWSVRDGSLKRLEVLMSNRQKPDKQNLLGAPYYFLPGKLFRRELFDKYGLLPDLSISEDTSWVFPAIANVDDIVYIDKPGYFYELSPNSISSSPNNPELADDALASSRIILDRTPLRYRSQAERYVMRRILNYYIPKFKGFRRHFHDFLHGHSSFCVRWCANAAQEEPSLCRKLQEEIEAEDVLIPPNVFVDGFRGPVNAEAAKTVFGSESDVIVLNSDNCNISDAPGYVRDAYEAGRLDEVAGYFGIRRIYENGGVYLNADMDIVNPFWRIREEKSFFAYDTEKTISSKVFGGLPGQKIYGLILESYEKPAFKETLPLADRIRIAAIGMTNFRNIQGHVERTGYGISLYSVSSFVFSDGEYRKYALSVDRRSSLPSIRAFDKEVFCSGNPSCRSDKENAHATDSVSETDQIRQYRQLITAMETSVVWRLKEFVKRPLSRVGIFYPLKKIGNTLLRVLKA